jgi:hypothetical protein
MTNATPLQSTRPATRLTAWLVGPSHGLRWIAPSARSGAAIPPDPAPGGDPAQRPNPGDPGPDFPEPREPVDPNGDPRIPREDIPSGV